MARPALEVADIFRDHGAAWRHANRGHVSLLRLKAMSAIENCRTAALGGHVARCEDCALLPPLRNGETAMLQDAKIEDKETRPPPRYNEGTLIEAMQSAWRFVDDEVLRDRLKEAKGIGTPATRAEIIGGLKKQGFLIAQGKNIVPTETGLSLFGVLKQADPALVDPGVTAQLECLLDDVVVGKQEMVGAIDAVCEVAERIISKLKEGLPWEDLLCLAAQGAMAQERIHRRLR